MPATNLPSTPFTTEEPTTLPPITTDVPVTTEEPTTVYIHVGSDVTVRNFVKGAQVVRGRDWRWGNQDGGAGNRGILMGLGHEGVVWVKWIKNGHEAWYRVGAEGKCDLRYA